MLRSMFRRWRSSRRTVSIDFIAQNNLGDLRFDEMSDDRIGHAFQKSELPFELLGDLRALIVQVKTLWRSGRRACWRTHWSVRLPASTPQK